MRAMDLADLSAKRPAAGRAEYKRRFSRLVKSAKGKRVAGNVFCSLLKTCRKVVANGGRASGDWVGPKASVAHSADRGAPRRAPP